MHRYAQLSPDFVCVGVSDLSGAVEANHMIPLPDDVGDEICGATWSDGEWIMPEPVDSPSLVPQVISDRQFFQNLAVRDLITESEALDAVGPGVIPAALDSLIAILPENQRFAARMLIRGATTFERGHPLAALIAQLYGWNNNDADTFWSEASAL